MYDRVEQDWMLGFHFGRSLLEIYFFPIADILFLLVRIYFSLNIDLFDGDSQTSFFLFFMESLL